MCFSMKDVRSGHGIFLVDRFANSKVSGYCVARDRHHVVDGTWSESLISNCANKIKQAGFTVPTMPKSGQTFPAGGLTVQITPKSGEKSQVHVDAGT